MAMHVNRGLRPRRALSRVATAAAAGLIFPATSAPAQILASKEFASSSPRHARALAAGFRALNVCTGTFFSGADLPIIEKMGGDLPAPALNFPTKIDRDAQIVSITYDEEMEPRYAVWRPGLGCTQLPIGATYQSARDLQARGSLPTPDYDSRPWPMGDKAAAVRLPGARDRALRAVIDGAFGDQSRYKGWTWGVIVVLDGKIVGERYAPGFGQHVAMRTHSACKSIAASVVGATVNKGLLRVQDPVSLFADAPKDDPRRAVTVDNLLHMGSGLYSEAATNPQIELYGGGASIGELLKGMVMDSRPGTRWVYSGLDTILALRTALDALPDQNARIAAPYRDVLWKIGMTRTLVELDWRNDFIASGQCWSTARDFARLGLLYLNNGVWGGERILPEDWATYVSTPAPAQPKGGRSYGAQFWIYGGKNGLPPTVYAAHGSYGQISMVIPQERLVIVRRGMDEREGFDASSFARDVIAAVHPGTAKVSK